MSKQTFNISDKAKWKAYLKGSIVGIAVSAALMLLFAVIITYCELDRAFAAPIATVCIAVGTLVAAFITAYTIGEKGYLAGIISAFLCFCIITVISLAVNGPDFGLNTLFHLIIILLSGLIGGMMGVGRKLRKKYI